MKIIVCIKQVPDTSEVRINPETNTLIRDGVPSIINPYDMHAVEAALWIKDTLGADLTVLTMGPPQAETALRETIAMGADNAVLLTDRAFAGSDTWATAHTLAAAVKFIGADIIICGKQAIDGDTAQVGPAIAEFLDIPHISYVSMIVSVSTDSITVRRLMDEGYDVVEATPPILLTVVKELNQPRMASLKGKIRAKKIEIRKLTHNDLSLDDKDLGLKGSPTQVKNIFAPEQKKDRIVIAGSAQDQADELISILRAIKCI
ncbi:MAG: electron transfer flavoprotein subunit beta/FixA family protein [Nitrospirae bacterium]|nr:electron transfer flavoprotein subunit beta/FixA family protein [Nitrospirota bacterium]